MKSRLKEARSLVAIRGATTHGSEKGIVLSTPEGLHGENTQMGNILQGKEHVRRSMRISTYAVPTLQAGLM
jgi:hypothetical protein